MAGERQAIPDEATLYEVAYEEAARALSEQLSLIDSFRPAPACCSRRALFRPPFSVVRPWVMEGSDLRRGWRLLRFSVWSFSRWQSSGEIRTRGQLALDLGDPDAAEPHSKLCRSLSDGVSLRDCLQPAGG